MTEENTKPEILEWNTGIKNMPVLKLVELEDVMSPPDIPHMTIPIAVTATIQLDENIQRQIIEKMMEASGPRELHAAQWLEKELGGTCSRANCLQMVKQVRDSYKSHGNQNSSAKIYGEIVQKFWADDRQYEHLKRVSNVYRINKPGDTYRTIETSIEWPKSMEKSDPALDNWMKETGSSGMSAEQAAGRLISKSGRVVSQDNVPSSVPPKSNRPKIQRGQR